MNKIRRSEIKNIIKQIEELSKDLENLRSEEEDYYDNIPENLQCSLRADDSEAAIDNMEDALDNLADAISTLECI